MTSRINRLLAVLIAAITVIGAVVWDCYTPYCSDDCYYRMVFKPDYNPSKDYWLSTNVEIRSFGDAWESVANHVRFNGRLANIAHILFQLTGRVPEAIFLGLCIGALFILMVHST